LSKARGLLHAADVPGEKVKKKKLAERENETPLSKNGVEKILFSVSNINYSMKCICPTKAENSMLVRCDDED